MAVTLSVEWSGLCTTATSTTAYTLAELLALNRYGVTPSRVVPKAFFR